jgi:hypothetical protein
LYRYPSAAFSISRRLWQDVTLPHHDALEFPEGQMVLLTNLFEGQEATVLQLPAVCKL